jgi:hypothetical protein
MFLSRAATVLRTLRAELAGRLAPRTMVRAGLYNDHAPVPWSQGANRNDQTTLTGESVSLGDGGIFACGSPTSGGDCTAVQEALRGDVAAIYNTDGRVLGLDLLPVHAE